MFYAKKLGYRVGLQALLHLSALCLSSRHKKTRPFTAEMNCAPDGITVTGIVSIFNQLSRASAYRYATPSRVAPFLYFSVLLAGLWDWLVFGTEPNAFSILGTALVVLGGLLKVFLRNWILGRQK